jgi:signal transduction histidine kinase
MRRRSPRPGRPAAGGERRRDDDHPPVGVAESSPLDSLVRRYLCAFNARDFDAWTELFDPDVVIRTDSRTMRGRDEVRAYAVTTVHTFPGIRAELDRVVAQSGGTIVVEYRLVNPSPAEYAWRLEGSVCNIYEVRDGLIASSHSYYLADQADQTEVAHVPTRVEATRIGEEQAALRRVATLVARGVAREEVFAAVNEEIAKLVGAEETALMRFEPDDTMTLVAAWSVGDHVLPIGANRPPDPALRELRRSGRPRRFGPAQRALAGPFAEEARQHGIRSSVGVPIEVDGRAWGVSFAFSSSPEPFPRDAEARIAAFTELIATAIANAQARSELRSLAEEQEALRRVATLVARGASQPEVFTAVTEQASRLLGGQPMALHRFDPDDHATIVAVHGAPIALGRRVPTSGDDIAARVLHTGLPSRVDSYPGLLTAAPVPHQIGMRAAVGAPIVVAGDVWGLLLAMSFGKPLPARTEGRLAQFAELVATAIANAESRAELTASRARVVAAADESRRRIQRDLHDGAQQRLVHAIIRLKLARVALGPAVGPEGELLDDALRLAEQATAELSELVRGIMPAALTHGGLRAGVESLVASAGLPVQVDVTPNRLPAPVETTAYFVIAEALTNAAKYAAGASVRVRAADEGGTLVVEVSDDGPGGVDPTRGTGLVGLTDRVAAGGGSIAVASPPGKGTTLWIRLPIGRWPARAR